MEELARLVERRAACSLVQKVCIPGETAGI